LQSADLIAARAQARLATGVVLFSQGAATGDWVARLPTIKASLHLGTGALGLALAGTPVGLVVAVQLVPFLVRRWSSAVTARWGMTAAALAIVLPALAWSVVSLAAALLILGVAFGISDISVNVQAVSVEQAYKRPMMSGLHAMWSVGLLTGSLVGALSARARIPPSEELVVAGLVLASIVQLGAGGFLEPRLERETIIEPGRPPTGSRVRFFGEPTLVIIGLIAFCSFLVEGSVSDWSGVYLHGTQRASLSTAALGVAVYSIGATLGRLVGNRVIGKFGRLQTLWRTALIAASGMAIAVVAGSPAVALAGYAVLGVGVAMIVPIAFSLSGVIRHVPRAWAMSRVTTLAYAGLFLGPPVIGLIARVTNLSVALSVPVVLLFLIAPVAFRSFRLIDHEIW
jgi:fucose permease